MLLRLQLISHQVLQRLGVNWALQLAGPDLLNVAGHIALDRFEGCASEHVKQSRYGFSGLEEFSGWNGIVVLDLDIVERFLAVKVGA